MRMRRLVQWTAFGAIVTSCSTPTAVPSASVATAALRDTLLTLFDSVVQIHQAVPDTAMIRRMHPVADTIMFVEGSLVHQFTGDSLISRVAAAHAQVTSMGSSIAERHALILGADHAMLTGLERVSWKVDTVSNTWEGLLTLVVARSNGRWVIRGYRH